MPFLYDLHIIYRPSGLLALSKPLPGTWMVPRLLLALSCVKVMLTTLPLFTLSLPIKLMPVKASTNGLFKVTPSLAMTVSITQLNVVKAY